jgi:tRNA nucleotidyltransferase/poly(A) polymerase
LGFVTQRLHPITVDRIDADAAKVVRRLSQHGHQAFLVGGCVRDLLLGHAPKDFDVATSATPEQIRRVFRNSRIIGRRFRLAHVFFGSKVIETATFRSTPEQPNEGVPLIWQDNQFGTAEEDALRRDFTVNGLFYDVASGKIIDVVDGLSDLRARLVRTIGDPDVRFPEDPVRIIRAVKFAARLGLAIEPLTRAAAVRHRGLLAACSVARVLEELYRLLRGGSATKTFQLLHELGALAVLMPELAAVLPPPVLLEAGTLAPALRAGRRLGPPRADAPTAAVGAAAPLAPAAPGLDEWEAEPAEVDDPAAEAEDAAPGEDDLALRSLAAEEASAEPGATPTPEDQVAPALSAAQQALEQLLAATDIDERALAEQLLELLGVADPIERQRTAELVWQQLEALDQLVQQGAPPPADPVLLAVLLCPLARRSLRRELRLGATVEQVDALVHVVGQRLHVARKHRERLRLIIVAQRRLERARTRGSLVQRGYFAEAQQLQQLRRAALGESALEAEEAGVEVEGAPRAGRRRRRRRSPRRTDVGPPAEG